MLRYDDYKVNVPEGRSGDWEVRRFTVTPEVAKFEMLRALLNPQRAIRAVPAGTYTSLTCCDQIVMSDTPDEIRDHLPFIQRAHGDLLIAGLGLGMVLQAVARKPEVKTVTVVERAPDVIKLVWPDKQPKVSIICDDIFRWKPPVGARYDYAWFDIWNAVSGDNLEEMRMLHRRYGRRGTTCDSWGYAATLAHRQAERRAARQVELLPRRF